MKILTVAFMLLFNYLDTLPKLYLTLSSMMIGPLTLTVLVTTIDALRHFETG